MKQMTTITMIAPAHLVLGIHMPITSVCFHEYNLWDNNNVDTDFIQMCKTRLSIVSQPGRDYYSLLPAYLLSARFAQATVGTGRGLQQVLQDTS